MRIVREAVRPSVGLNQMFILKVFKSHRKVDSNLISVCTAYICNSTVLDLRDLNVNNQTL